MPPNLLLLLIRAGLPITNERVLQIGGAESRRLRHNFIGTEHVLCALARIPDLRVGQFFAERGAGIHNIRAGVVNAVGLGPPGSPPPWRVLTPRLKKVVAIAADQASEA